MCLLCLIIAAKLRNPLDKVKVYNKINMYFVYLEYVGREMTEYGDDMVQ